MAVLRFVRAILLAASWALMPAAGHTAADEYQVKAVFLFNFSRFVEWPASAFPKADTPFVVGVYGNDPFGGDLDEVVKGETANGHPLTVRRVRSAAEAAACQILFIPKEENRRLDELVSALAKSNTLTVSDLPGASQRGVMIRLVTENGRIRLRIDVEAARAAQLTISSNLLRAAEIVAANGGP
jgi:hypothetical protein